jgi:organic radical activating enzyme
MAPLVRKGVEYSLTDHCNLSCYGCDHASPLLHPRFASPVAFQADLAALQGILHVQHIYLIGGEPLIHPEVLEFAQIAKASGIADTVALVTNGVLLHQAPDDLWKTIGRIDLTLYPGVPLRIPFATLVSKALHFGVRLNVRRSGAFRQTLLNDQNTDMSLVQKIFDACKIAHDYQCHAIYDGRYYKCSVAPYVPKRLALKDRLAVHTAEDGVSLHHNPNLRRDLERYLTEGKALGACSFCLGTSGYWRGHHQLSLKGRRDWLGEDHTDIPHLVDPTQLDRVRRRV